MRQIQLIGPVDKRVVAYPLFKTCDVLGKTLVITDDANFRRFADNYEDRFTVGRSDFVVTNDISKSIIEELGVKLSAYDFVIIISTNVLIENNDSIVYCHGSSQLMCTEEVLDCLSEIEGLNDLTISTHKPNAKDSLYLSLDTRLFGYIWDCEENKRFVPCKNPDLAKLIYALFGESVFNVKSMTDIANFMAKDV